MKTRSLALAGLFLALASTIGVAASAHTVAHKTVPITYQCSKCHMKFSAAEARKDKYMDPMDGGKLVPVKSETGPKHVSGASM